MLKRCIDRLDDLVVVFFDPDKKRHQELVGVLELIDDDAERLDVNMVKASSKKSGRHFGLTHLPAVVYFERGVPNVYDGDLTPDDVQHWIHEHKTGAHAVIVTGAMLEMIKEESDSTSSYRVFFSQKNLFSKNVEL